MVPLEPLVRLILHAFAGSIEALASIILSFICPCLQLLAIGSHLGKLTFILAHTAFSTERMPTSQVGFSTCLVPSRDEILGDNAEKQLCRVIHDKNANKH